MSSSRVNDLQNSRIPLEEIIKATNHFSSESRVGEGGFGVVYKGELSIDGNNRSVAIKRRPLDSNQGKKEFENELKMYLIFNHPNIIGFIGYCDDANELILVSEYATEGSLDYHLQDPNKRGRLTWEQRLKICLGAARGIKYLHSGVGEYERIIHRDMKSANILLDDNLEAKICDFCLSRLSPRNQPNTHVLTRASGTRFYMDPDYNEREKLTKEADIYSFGVVMFEMSSGMMAYNSRKLADGKKSILIDLVRTHYDDHALVGRFRELMDTAIQIDTSSFQEFNEIALDCINMDRKKRPTINKIVERIEDVLDALSREKYMLGPKDLFIDYQGDTKYWKLGHIPESRFPEVWILEQVWWLGITCNTKAVKLSPNSTYVTYLIFRTNAHSFGLSLPAETMVSFGGVTVMTQNVFLQRPQLVQENYVCPRLREDGWMEIKLGKFKCKEGDDGELKMYLKQLDTNKRKAGLIVEGIEIRLVLS